jgi:hypothetical protein
VELEAFKKRVSKKVLVVHKEMDELRTMFVEFEKAQSRKIHSYVFTDKSLLFDSYLKVDADKIVMSVQNEINRAKMQLKKRQDLKDEKIQSILKAFFQDIMTETFYNKDRKAAIKTMRKLPLYGFKSNGMALPDFEWPTAQDILKMPDDSQPLRIASIEWQNDFSRIGMIQVVLTNGQKSPVFANPHFEATETHRVELPIGVKRIKGSCSQDYIKQLNFIGDDD